jgi:hypothetical protein
MSGIDFVRVIDRQIKPQATRRWRRAGISSKTVLFWIIILLLKKLLHFGPYFKEDRG